MIFGLGFWELLLLTLLVGLLFGFGHLPQLAKDVGRLHGTVQRVKDELRNLLRFF